MRDRKTRGLSPAKQLDAASKLAFQAGHHRAAEMIDRLREERFPRGDTEWSFGRCLPCEIEDKLVRATVLDVGSGTPECDRHNAERFEVAA